MPPIQNNCYDCYQNSCNYVCKWRLFVMLMITVESWKLNPMTEKMRTIKTDGIGNTYHHKIFFILLPIMIKCEIEVFQWWIIMITSKFSWGSWL